MVSASFAASPGLAAAAKPLGSDPAGYLVDAAQHKIPMPDGAVPARPAAARTGSPQTSRRSLSKK